MSAGSGGAQVRVDVAGLEPGQTRAIECEGVAILLCNVEGELFAVENRCSHAAVPLTEATLDGCELECPYHGALYDVRDGSALALPARVGLRRFTVNRDGDAAVVVL